MSDIARLIIEQGRAAAEARAAQGQVWGRTADTLSQIPAQVMDQQRQRQQLGMQQQELQARTALQGQQFQMNAGAMADQATARQNQGKLDQILSDPSIYNSDGSINREGIQGKVSSQVPHLWPAVSELVDKLESSRETIQRKAQDLAVAHQDALGQDARGLNATGNDPSTFHLIITARAKDGTLSKDQAASLLNVQTPEQVAAVTRGWIAQSKSATAEALKSNEPIVVPADANLVRKDTGRPLFTAPPKPSEAETARHNAAMEAIQKLQVGREAAANAETARHNRATELANNPFLGMTAPGQGAPPGAPPGQTAAIPGATAPAQQPVQVSGQVVLDKLPPPVASTVKALAEGRMQFPAGFALKSPYWQNMIALVGQYDPSFDAVNYNARSKTRADFTSGKSAQTINALNTVTQHLGKLSDSTDALNNSSLPPYNTIANLLSKATGHPQVTTFEADKKAVTDELTRAWRGAGGSEADIKSWGNVLDASQSPAQLHSAIAEIGGLLEGKLSALDNQYQQGMGHQREVPVITPQARATLSKLETRAGKAPAGKISVTAPDGSVHSFDTQAQADTFKQLAGINK